MEEIQSLLTALAQSSLDRKTDSRSKSLKAKVP